MRPHPRVPRLPIVGVMGSGTDAWPERTAPLGRALAARGVHLLTGGGAGVMHAVSEAFATTPGRRGLVLGIVPGDMSDPAARPGYPNAWVEIPIRTHLPLSGHRGTDPMSRNHINVLTADAVIALPGGAGTASEVALAVRYRRPVVAFLDNRYELPGMPDEVAVASDLAAVARFLDGVLGPRR